MKLRELTGYKGNAHYQAAKNTLVKDNPGDENWRQFNKFKEYMDANGFSHKGMGAYGTVFEKPGYEWLFKLYKNDPAYDEFIRYSKKHADNPHLPKFYGAKIKINDDTSCIRTEKLTKLPYDMYRQYMEYFTAVFAILAERVDPNDSTYDQLYREYEQFSRKHPNLFEVLKYIFTESAYYPDLHNGNIMMRGKTLVFSDPVAL